MLMASAGHLPLIQGLADELGVDEPRFTMKKNDCILCGLCVRACAEIVGVAAISFINRGIEKRVSPPFEINSNTCIECGTCVLICPTGTLTLSDIRGDTITAHQWDSPFTAAECSICGNHNLTPKLTESSDVLKEIAAAHIRVDEEARA
jgi:predicted molibdopterin-dependent oxidoreductase YjgC